MGGPLPQDREFKYFVVWFMSVGNIEQAMDRRFGATSGKVLYQNVVVKKQLSCKAELSIYRSVYVLTLTDGHEPMR